MCPQTVRETSVGLVDRANEDCLRVADRPTSHRCWPSRSAFQGWQCLDNTSQCRCWRWKPIEPSAEEEMFTASVHCGALLDAEREDVRGRDEHALTLQWSVSWRQSIQGFTALTEAGMPSKLLLTTVSWRCGWDDFKSWESWDGNWLELEVLLTSRSWWWTLCRESLALISFVECGTVLQV